MKLLQFLIRVAKFAAGLLLLPACAGATMSLYQDLLGPLSAQVWFVAGFGAFILIFAIFQQPIKTYVFGHELTHAFWILLFRGEVTAFSASAKGGKVEGTKGNFLIALSPYFFPVYTILLIALYYLATLLWEPQRYTEAFVSLIGFTWAFHIILTISVLLKGQTEVKKNGYLFSIAVIYLMNILVLGIVLTFLSPDFGLADLVSSLRANAASSYARFGEALGALSAR